MSMVEGIGDEVLQFFAIIIILALALLAWWSTSISEGPIRTVLILERRTRSRLTNDLNPPPSVTFTGSNENSIDTGQVDTANIQELVENDGPELTGNLNSNNTDDKEDESSSSLLLPTTNQPPASVVNINNETTTDNGSSNQNNDELLQSQAPQVEVIEQLRSSRECESADNDDSDPFILRRRRIAFFQSRGPTLLESSSSSSEPDNEQEIPAVMQDSDNAQDDTDSTNPDHIRIRLKYLNDDQIVVEGRLHEQLGDFKRRHFRIELAAEKMVRLIFNGQVLQSDSQTLQGYGLFDNCVVHCLVHNQRNNAPRAAQTQTNGTTNQSTPPDWNLGTLLYACLSFILGFAWYCRYQYSHLFTVTTTAALFGLTGMFVVTVLSINLPDHDALQ